MSPALGDRVCVGRSAGDLQKTTAAWVQDFFGAQTDSYPLAQAAFDARDTGRVNNTGCSLDFSRTDGR
jgi:hypothetical protein